MSIAILVSRSVEICVPCHTMTPAYGNMSLPEVEFTNILLPETDSSPLKRWHLNKGKDGFPRIHFQGRTVTFREAIWFSTKGIAWSVAFDSYISTAHNSFQDRAAVRFQEGCDIIAYSTAISACEKAYQWQAAMSLLFNTLLAKMKMDLIAYSATISACEKCQQWQYALLLFHEIKAGSHVDLITYNSVISACENAGKWQEALELLFEAEVVSLKTTTMTYNVAISACEKGHTWEARQFRWFFEC